MKTLNMQGSAYNHITCIFPNYMYTSRGAYEVSLGLFSLKIHDWFITQNINSLLLDFGASLFEAVLMICQENEIRHTANKVAFQQTVNEQLQFLKPLKSCCFNISWHN